MLEEGLEEVLEEGPWDEAELAALITAIVATGGRNRLAASFSAGPGAWSRTRDA
ncbi:MAG: hypothetical protein ACE5HP_12055 [Gemmatimonadota bacterium]